MRTTLLPFIYLWSLSTGVGGGQTSGSLVGSSSFERRGPPKWTVSFLKLARVWFISLTWSYSLTIDWRTFEWGQKISNVYGYKTDNKTFQVVVVLVVVVLRAIFFNKEASAILFIYCFICITSDEISDHITQERASTIFNVGDFSNTINRQPTWCHSCFMMASSLSCWMCFCICWMTPW